MPLEVGGRRGAERVRFLLSSRSGTETGGSCSTARCVPSSGIAAPHFLHFIRARLPAIFASGTLNFVEQLGQLASMVDEAQITGANVPRTGYHGRPSTERDHQPPYVVQ
jgi:hypothetical protein